ncbi:hypothetical protein CI266_003582 [Salmonella enterica subsp. enterica serovar Kotte]|nr:hypothetical protein [Salmonella enterica subsp. enterica serovar Kotte]
MTNKPLTTERLEIMLAETLGTTAARGYGASIEVTALIFIKVLREVLERRKAAMDTEPVAWMATDSDGEIEYNGHDQFSSGCGKSIPLYAAPPVPVVPEEKRDDDGNTTSEFDHGWNACREAMLNGGKS